LSYGGKENLPKSYYLNAFPISESELLITGLICGNITYILKENSGAFELTLGPMIPDRFEPFFSETSSPTNLKEKVVLISNLHYIYVYFKDSGKFLKKHTVLVDKSCSF